MAITEATIHVVKIKITALCHLALIPKYCAFSSPSDKITICRCNRHNISTSGASLGAAGAIVIGAGTTVEKMFGAFIFGMLSLILVIVLVKIRK